MYKGTEYMLTAILVDGDFFLKCYRKIYGFQSPAKIDLGEAIHTMERYLEWLPACYCKNSYSDVPL